MNIDKARIRNFLEQKIFIPRYLNIARHMVALFTAFAVFFTQVSFGYADYYKDEIRDQLKNMPVGCYININDAGQFTIGNMPVNDFLASFHQFYLASQSADFEIAAMGITELEGLIENAQIVENQESMTLSQKDAAILGWAEVAEKGLALDAGLVESIASGKEATLSDLRGIFLDSLNPDPDNPAEMEVAEGFIENIFNVILEYNENGGTLSPESLETDAEISDSLDIEGIQPENEITITDIQNEVSNTDDLSMLEGLVENAEDLIVDAELLASITNTELDENQEWLLEFCLEDTVVGEYAEAADIELEEVTGGDITQLIGMTLEEIDEEFLMDLDLPSIEQYAQAVVAFWGGIG